MKLTYNIESCVKDEKLRNNADFIMLVYKQKLTKWINSCTRECQLNSIKSSYEDLYTTSLVRSLSPLIDFYSETESDKIKNRDVKFMENDNNIEMYKELDKITALIDSREILTAVEKAVELEY